MLVVLSGTADYGDVGMQHRSTTGSLALVTSMRGKATITLTIKDGSARELDFIGKRHIAHMYTAEGDHTRLVMVAGKHATLQDQWFDVTCQCN
ncbi:Hypothetical protein PHPALM_16378 [Phytophthora palmivora]|uniref:Uncharacterized protein n=1 Tax=Phytophthora palmivora TaxID=4796 RepID=A0A2P4XPV7_9STRA|nr:Hypothetical protein PHPALM_16378 [Phytophthora palmivora]